MNSEQEKKLVKYIVKAVAILKGESNEGETEYDENLDFLLNLFNKEEKQEVRNLNDKKDEELFRARTVVLDSFYSTNLSRSLYWFDGLKNKLSVASKNSHINNFDESLRFLAFDFLKQLENNKNYEKTPINNLFNEKISYNKEDFFDGELQKNEGKKAPSFISKYLYFLTYRNFPILDSIAKESLKDKKVKNLINASYTNKDVDEIFFETICKFHTKVYDKLNNYYVTKSKPKSKFLKKNYYHEIDNFLWLYGKIRRGNFSLILKKNELKNLCKSANGKLIELAKKGNKKYKNGELKTSGLYDTAIKNYLHEAVKSKTELSNIFKNKDLSDFIKFVFEET